SQAAQEPAAAEPVADDHPTQPSMPAIPARTEPAVVALGTADEMPTSAFKTPLPGTVSSTNGGQPAAAAPTEPEVKVEAEPEPHVPAEPATAGDAAPVQAAEPEAVEPREPSEPQPVQSAESEPEPEPAAEPEPVSAPGPEEEPPIKEPESAPEPARASEPEPQPAREPVQPAAAAGRADEWVPMPENPPVPNWAPNFGAAIKHPIAPKSDAAVPAVPGWAPSTSSMPAASRQSTASSVPAQAPRPPQPAAQTPASSPSMAAASGFRPPDPAQGRSSSSWEIVQPKPEQPKQAYAGPSAEDKSYAEWFAWAKRSGAPAGACHAAAQGAFRALASGNDMNTAVQWATLAMAQPPGLVGAQRQLYCAWYSLGNIDLRLPTPQAHAFATGAIAALDGGADAPTAHQAGLAAAGVTG